MIKLHHHQLEAVDFLLKTKRGILADKCGLGKTFSAISFASMLPGRILIVCPAYLTYNWQQEIVNLLGNVSIDILSSNIKDKEQLINRNSKFLVTSYGMLSQMKTIERNNKKHTTPKYKQLHKIKWGCVIYDEGHRLRNQNTNTAKNARRITSKCCAILTATPIIKNFGDLFSLLKICDSKTFSSYWRFVQDHCYLTKTPWATKVGNVKDMDYSFNSIKDYMLVRSAKDVDIDWPNHVVKEIKVIGSTKLYKAYKSCKRTYVAQIGDIKKDCLASADLIANLRKMLINPPGNDNYKLKAIKDIIKDTNGKVIVFVWYVDTAEFLQKKLNAQLITGNISMKERKDIIHKWQYTSKNKVLVATITSVNEGNNWQFCSTQIFCDTHWTMAVNEQAIGRCVRYGQKDTVRVFIVKVDKTIDNRIWDCAKSRAIVNDKLLLLKELQSD